MTSLAVASPNVTSALPRDLERLQSHLAYLRNTNLWAAGVPAAEARFYMVCQPNTYGFFDWERLVWLVDPEDDNVARARRGATPSSDTSFVHGCRLHGKQALRSLDDYVVPWKDSASANAGVAGDEACGEVTWNVFVDQSGAPKSATHAEFVARQERLDRWGVLVQDIPEAYESYVAFCRDDYVPRRRTAS